MNWRLAPMIGLVAVLAPAMAHAQTNLDQGKSASQIFAAACAECHKAPRAWLTAGIAPRSRIFCASTTRPAGNRRRRLPLTCSVAAAPSLLGLARRARAKSPPSNGPNVVQRPQSRSPSRPNAKRGHPRPDEAARTEAKSDAKPEVKPEVETGPGERPPTSATRGRRREPKPPLLPMEAPGVARAPAAVAEPAPSPPPGPEASPEPTPTPTPETSTPGDAASGESAPVPRDNIPD